MKRAKIVVIIIFIIMGIVFTSLSWAEEAPYSGDFWTRSTMTGDWGGTRSEWAAKGVTFDINWTQTAMSVISGGKHQGWEYSGRGIMTLNIDTQKLGLWPGGFFTVEAEGNYNRSINLDPGALMAVNTSQLFPTQGKLELNIPAVTFTQFFSESFGVFLGKLDTTGGDANEFAHGKGDEQFMNLAFNFSPVTLLTTPNSALGAGVIILPTKDSGAAVITLSAIDSNGKANRSGFDTAFEGNTTYAVEGRVRTGLFGMTGHQLLGATYSTKNFISLSQDLRLIIQNLPIKEEDNSWSIFYNFDQYIYEPKKGQGIGLFGRLGASDGDANPVHYFYSIGIGGKGVINSRPHDSFGLGYYYADISNPELTGLFRNRKLLRDEYGVEVYYSIAITPWMKLTPDIQFVRPAQEHAYNINNGILTISKEEIKTATVIGLRLQMIF